MPNAAQHVDIVIIGGGCAGLSLARELASCGYLGSVVIVEPRATYTDDRSWCFWAPVEHALSDWISHNWSSWTFGQTGQAHQTRTCPGYSYQYVRSLDFYDKSRRCIAASSNIALMLDEKVTHVQEHPKEWLVETNSSAYTANYVVDTRPASEDRLLKSTLFQSFVGFEMYLDQPLTNAYAVELMTDMRLINGEFCFSYVLPFDRQHVLVETTFFARAPMGADDIERELNQLLIQRGWANGDVLRREYGVLPMGLAPLVSKAKPGLIQSGMGGGALRASSGYGFMRIQRWAQRCASQLKQGVSPSPNLETTGLLQQMDRIFLKVLQQKPALAPQIFSQLLGRVAPHRFIRFMDDRPNLLDMLSIISSMPTSPFLQALIDTKRS
jgi:lycopene beta-cyclase